MYAQTRWWAIAALTLLYLGVFLNAFWIWGLLMLVWAFQDIRRGSTHLLETVARRSNPWTFWAIEITWAMTGLYFILNDMGLLPESMRMTGI